jgi:hypothetical protein
MDNYINSEDVRLFRSKYGVSHPAIETAQALYFIAKTLFVVEVLWYTREMPIWALLVAVAIMWLIYQTNRIN